MGLSGFTIRIILLFVPGIIALKIIGKLTYYKDKNIFTFIIDSMLLGFCCYFTYYIFVKLMAHFGNDFQFTFIEALISAKVKLEMKEILYATIASIFVGVFLSYMINYKVFIKIAHLLHCSHKHGDIDILHYILNSKSENSNWVVVRDEQNDFMYEGWLTLCSEMDERDEIFLVDVKVYRNSTAEYCFKTPALYLPMERNSLIIEFPLLKEEKGKGIFQYVKRQLILFWQWLKKCYNNIKKIEQKSGRRD